jgi:hypothetical protein
MFFDCFGEVANMITGNATGLLNPLRDQVLHITTPAIASGANLGAHLVPKAALVIESIMQYGPIEISIAVEESENPAGRGGPLGGIENEMCSAGIQVALSPRADGAADNSWRISSTVPLKSNIAPCARPASIVAPSRFRRKTGKLLMQLPSCLRAMRNLISSVDRALPGALRSGGK